MTVYRIRLDVNNFKYFVNKYTGNCQALYTNGLPKKENWICPELVLSGGEKAIGNFYNFNTDCLISDMHTFNILNNFLSNGIEVINIIYDHIDYYLYNVLNITDCLNKQTTKYITAENSNNIIDIKEFSFIPSKIIDSVIFKIPETISTDVYCTDCENSLKSIYDKNKLKGLVFKKIWSVT